MAFKSVASNETTRLLEVAQLPGVGAVTLRNIIKSSPNFEQAFNALNFQLSRREGEGFQKSLSANEIIRRCYEERIVIISPFDAEYPAPLLHIPDFPPLLYIKGSIESLSMPSCAVVGTREVSKLGTSWARQVAMVLAERNFSVVSGLALGVDTAAHEGALRAGGTTVAVLAHGLDKVTPASNRHLCYEILDFGGAIVSEHPPGVPPRRPEYVRRNRIQSGLSVCSIVVESGETGGTMHQGKFTQEQGRLLFCLWPSQDEVGANEFRYEGARKLMRERGAIPLSSRSDLEALIDSNKLIGLYDRLHLQPRFSKERFI